MQAIHRNLNHVVYHTGQIVQLARDFTGDAWRTLTIAPGKSEDFNAAMRAKYGDQARDAGCWGHFLHCSRAATPLP